MSLCDGLVAEGQEVEALQRWHPASAGRSLQPFLRQGLKGPNKYINQNINIYTYIYLHT